MKCTILHESRGRLRVHVCNVRMTLHRADVLEAYLNHHDAVSKAKVYERTGEDVYKRQDEGYVTLINAKYDKDDNLVEANERTGIWAWKHPHHDGTTTYHKLEGDITFKMCIRDRPETASDHRPRPAAQAEGPHPRRLHQCRGYRHRRKDPEGVP